MAAQGRERRWAWSRGQTRIAVALLACAVVVGAVAGFIRYAVEGDDPYPSRPQRELIARSGAPPLWILADGPTQPGGKSHRVELWIYPLKGESHRFIDGALVGSESLGTGSHILGGATVSPAQLHRELKRVAVEKLLGEDGVPVEGVAVVYPGSATLAYSGHRLLITYLDGRFFAAQPY